jgi:hypothetical protein
MATARHGEALSTGAICGYALDLTGPICGQPADYEIDFGWKNGDLAAACAEHAALARREFTVKTDQKRDNHPGHRQAIRSRRSHAGRMMAVLIRYQPDIRINGQPHGPVYAVDLGDLYPGVHMRTVFSRHPRPGGGHPLRPVRGADADRLPPVQRSRDRGGRRCTPTVTHLWVFDPGSE